MSSYLDLPPEEVKRLKQEVAEYYMSLPMGRPQSDEEYRIWQEKQWAFQSYAREAGTVWAESCQKSVSIECEPKTDALDIIAGINYFLPLIRPMKDENGVEHKKVTLRYKSIVLKIYSDDRVDVFEEVWEEYGKATFKSLVDAIKHCQRTYYHDPEICECCGRTFE